MLVVGFAPPAAAAMVEFERIKVHATVGASGRVDVTDPRFSFEFGSNVEFGPRQRPTGGMHVVLLDGSVRLYQAVGAALLSEDQCLVFFLGGVPGALDPSDPAIAIVRDASPGPGVVSVELQIRRVFPQPLQFEVPGAIRLARSDPPAPAARLRFSLHHARQEVVLGGLATTAGFAAHAFAGSDHHAWGRMSFALPGERPPLSFEPVFGVALPATGAGPGAIVMLTVLAGAPLEIGNLGVATVRPDPAVPGCDIWDFTSNVVVRNAPLHVVFEAEGRTHFYDHPGR